MIMMTWIIVLRDAASTNQKLFGCLVFCVAITSGLFLGRLFLPNDQYAEPDEDTKLIDHSSQELYHRTQILTEIRDEILMGKHFTGIVNNSGESEANSNETALTNLSYRIPNIIHYVIYSRYIRPFQFTEYVSVLSAFQNQDPEQIWIHCNQDPIGMWWDQLMENISWFHLQVVHMEIPEKIGSTSITNLDQAIDIAKIQILSKYGGIYLDTDIIVIQSFDPLRNYQTVYGQEGPMKTSPAILLAEPNSKFLDLVYKYYLQDYRPNNPDYNNGQVPYRLAMKHPDLVYIESVNLVAPGFAKTHLLFSENIELSQWRQYYAVHLRFHGSESKIYNPTYIKPLKNLVGRLLKYIYYGSEDIVDSFKEHTGSARNHKIGIKNNQSPARYRMDGEHLHI